VSLIYVNERSLKNKESLLEYNDRGFYGFFLLLLCALNSRSRDLRVNIEKMGLCEQ
jgi:hypothetical protein